MAAEIAAEKMKICCCTMLALSIPHFVSMMADERKTVLSGGKKNLYTQCRCVVSLVLSDPGFKDTGSRGLMWIHFPADGGSEIDKQLRQW